MSGGKWDYKQEELKEILERVAYDMRGMKITPRLSVVMDSLAEKLEEVIHDLDWHLCGDTHIDDFEKFEEDAIKKIKECI